MARHVCVDGLFLHPRHFATGVHSYSVQLLRQMESLTSEGEDTRFSVLVPSLEEIKEARLTNRPGFEVVPCGLMRWDRLWRLGMYVVAAQRLRPDAVFLPFPFLVTFKPVHLAVMVHDVIPLRFPRARWSLRDSLFRQSYSSSLARADLILTNSEYSKSDLVSICGVPPERIVVAHLGFDSGVFNSAPPDTEQLGEVQRRPGIDGPYVLHVGNMEPRKNLVRLVRAYRLLTERRRDLSLQLVLCGGQNWGCEDLDRLLEEPEFRGRVVLTGAVPDRELSLLYRGAVCFAMPSLYEGFGFPLLEAMASAVPVMSSNRTSLPEIAADAALYFDPESIEEMAGAMERLVTDSDLREQLVRRGLERAKQFSWVACARTTLAALKTL